MPRDRGQRKIARTEALDKVAETAFYEYSVRVVEIQHLQTLGGIPMTLDKAIAELKERISAVCPSAVIRVMRASEEEASIRAYAPVDQETAIKDATRDRTIQLLTEAGLDVQVFVYDIATSLPSE